MRTIIDAKKLLDLAKRGMTAAQIARDMDIPIGTVCSYATRTNIDLTKGKRGGNTRKHVQPDYTTGIGVTPVNARLSEIAAHEARTLAEIKQATHAEARTCECRKPTPVEALTLKIKLPWAGKVQQQTPADLAPDLYDELIIYANFDPADIAQVFGFTPAGFQVWLKKYGYPVRDAVVAEPVEHDLTIKPRPGQTFAGRKKEMDATPVFRAHDVVLSELSELVEQIHAPTVAEIEELFAAEDDKPIPFALTLRECAARLLVAIDDRDDAGKRIEFYRGEIRRMA